MSKLWSPQFHCKAHVTQSDYEHGCRMKWPVWKGCRSPIKQRTGWTSLFISFEDPGSPLKLLDFSIKILLIQAFLFLVQKGNPCKCFLMWYCHVELIAYIKMTHRVHFSLWGECGQNPFCYVPLQRQKIFKRPLGASLWHEAWGNRGNCGKWSPSICAASIGWYQKAVLHEETNPGASFLQCALKAIHAGRMFTLYK